MRKVFQLTVLLLFGACAAACGQTNSITADTTESTITYHVDHFFHSVDGISKHVTCHVYADAATHKLSSVSIAVNVNTFDSGNSSRDNTAMDAVDASHYPEVTFQSDTVVYTSDSTLQVTGRLTFHGIAKQFSLPVQVTHKEGGTAFDGSFGATFSGFNVTRPSLMFIPISDKFRLTFHVVFREAF